MMRSRFFYAALFVLSPLPVLADSWDSLASISAEPTPGYVCYGNADGKNITCNSTAPYVDATGKVGIGTTIPTAPLSVFLDNGSAGGSNIRNFSGASQLFLQRSAGTLASPAQLTGVNTVGYVIGSGFDETITMRNIANIEFISAGTITSTSAPGRLAFSTTASGSLGPIERMRINESGNVGIGTTSPAHKLDVNGNIGLAASSYVNWAATDGSTGYGLRDNAGTLEYKNSGGAWSVLGGVATNFAAGTAAAPGLYVTGDSDTGLFEPSANALSIAAGGVEAARFNTAASAVNYLSVTPSATGSAVQIATAGSDTNVSLALMPKGTGGVGIGTASPSVALDVYGSSIFVTNASDIASIKTYGYRNGTAANAFNSLRARGTSVSPAALQSGDAIGNFGAEGYNGSAFTGNSSALIQFVAAENFTSTAMGTGIDFITTSLGSASSARTTKMKITADGIVAIGTTAPASDVKADINGAAKIAGTGSETCATAADLGKIRLNPATGRIQICRQ